MPLGIIYNREKKTCRNHIRSLYCNINPGLGEFEVTFIPSDEGGDLLPFIPCPQDEK